MRHVIDYDLDAQGNPVVPHVIDLTPGSLPDLVDNGVLGLTVSRLNMIVQLHTGVRPIAGTGWDVMTRHPGYLGKTRLEALIGEVKRLNDAVSRAALGV